MSSESIIDAGRRPSVSVRSHAARSISAICRAKICHTMCKNMQLTNQNKLTPHDPHNIVNNMTSLPISEIIKKGPSAQEDVDDSGEPQLKRSRHEDYKKAKELEEARKAGNAPALVDESGKDINPHIPQYISTVPFFYNTNQPTLRHQRSLNQHKAAHVPLDLNIPRGVKIQTATKYRPGACENCGSMTHKRKDCMERPRKVGAKFTNKEIAPDEVVVPEIKHTFDSKRDRWAGYQPEMYKETIDEYNKVEEAKRKLKEEKLKQEAEAAKNDEAKAGPSTSANGDVPLNDVLDDSTSDDDSDDEDEKYADKADMPGTKVDTKQRITVRNLRLREDTAKYLYNLDPNSAYYDPKTRSMRENPLPADKTKDDAAPFPGENFIRYTGDVKDVNKAQVFAWQAADKGIDIHLQALPTKTAIVQKEFEINKNQYNERINKYIKQKYGEPEEQAKSAKDLQLAQSEVYVEYSRTGKPSSSSGGKT